MFYKQTLHSLRPCLETRVLPLEEHEKQTKHHPNTLFGKGNSRLFEVEDKVKRVGLHENHCTLLARGYYICTQVAS